MKKKKLALAYEINDNQILDFINQIEEYKKKFSFDAILLFSNNLTDDNKNKINKIYPCVYIRTTKIKKAKFEIFNYLKEFKTVIYTTLDNELSDTLIQKYCNNYYSVKLFPNTRFVEANFKRILKSYNMFEVAQSSDLIVVTDKIKNYNKITNWCIKKSIFLYPWMINRVDGILDLMIQEFKIPITNIVNKKSLDIPTKYSYQQPKIQKIKEKLSCGPLVTILMSIYDRTEYLDEAIKSILKQSYNSLEILIVLEYSKKQEEINHMLLSYHDKRIKIIKNKKKLGLAESLNVGMKLAKGKYLARMDDDDISCLNRIEKQVAYLENNPNISIVGTFMKFFGNSDLVCKLATNSDCLKIKCLYKTPLFHPTVMFRLDDLRKHKLFYKSNVYAEDYELWSRVISKLNISNIPEILYYYRLGAENKSLQDENSINSSHHNIMRYQLKHYLGLDFNFDKLQLLSGRIDVLGNSVNLTKIYSLKLKMWKKIIKANKKSKFYTEQSILDEIKELKDYYNTLRKIKKS